MISVPSRMTSNHAQDIGEKWIRGILRVVIVQELVKSSSENSIVQEDYMYCIRKDSDGAMVDVLE
jgi:hypothetical protein